MLDEKKAEWDVKKHANEEMRLMYERSCGGEYEATVQKLDLPTLQQLITESAYEDTQLVLCIASGFRITGKLGIGGLEKVVEGGFHHRASQLVLPVRGLSSQKQVLHTTHARISSNPTRSTHTRSSR